MIHESAKEAGNRDGASALPASSNSSPLPFGGPTFDEPEHPCKAEPRRCPLSGKPGRAERDPDRHVPGSCVGPVNPLECLLQLVQEVLRCPRLGRFLKSCFRKAEPDEVSGEPSRGPGQGSWPMPLPYPEAFRADPKSLAIGELKKLFVNVQICLLNFLDLGRPSRALPSCLCGGPLAEKQWEAVKRFECFLDAWFELGVLNATDMGRTASKIEDLENALRKLKQMNSGGGSPLRGGNPKLGRLSGTKVGTFKPVESERLQFRGYPDFDPAPFLDTQSKEIYEHPFEHSLDLADYMGEVPRVRVHCSREERLKLYQLLDKSRRIKLFSEEQVRGKFGSGVFAVLKSMELDRLILDLRPHNLLESPPGRLIQMLGSGEALTHLHLEGGERLYISSNDIRDFYHLFHVSSDRCRRNCLVGSLNPREASSLQAFRPDLWNVEKVYVGLSCLAMGDTQAVEIAQLVMLDCAVRKA